MYKSAGPSPLKDRVSRDNKFSIPRLSPDRDRRGSETNSPFLLTGMSENGREKPSTGNLEIAIIQPANSNWTELKTPGKNIAKRCYHISTVFDNKLFIHGGYELNTGIMKDFQYLKISENFNLSGWQAVQTNSEVQPGPLCRHTALLWQSRWYVFGGQISSVENTRKLWVFDFLKSAWKLYGPRGKDQVWPNSVHSHSCNYYSDGDGDGVDEMVISFGFIGDKIADHSNQVWTYNLQKDTWNSLFPHTPNSMLNVPEARSGQATAIVRSTLYVFGGAQGDQRLNDMWGFDLKSCKWQLIQLGSRIIPEPRFGHSMNVHNNKVIILFGGFQDIAHERDDLMAFDVETKKWEILEVESIADKSPEKKFIDFDSSPSSIRKKTLKSPFRPRGFPSAHGRRPPSENSRRAPSEQSQRWPSEQGPRPFTVEASKKPRPESQSFMNRSMAKSEGGSAMIQQKQAKRLKEFLANKKTLLDQFEIFDPNLMSQLKKPSPTTQTMKHSLEAITAKVGFRGKNQTTDSDLIVKGGTLITPKLFETIKQLPTVKDGKIHGRRAGARDGHSAEIYKGKLLIFGGDRHKMSYNDIFIFDLEKFFG